MRRIKTRIFPVSQNFYKLIDESRPVINNKKISFAKYTDILARSNFKFFNISKGIKDEFK